LRIFKLVIKDGENPLIEMRQGNVKEKGYVSFKKLAKIMNAFYRKEEESKKVSYCNYLNFVKKGIIAADIEDDCYIVSIPADEYFIPEQNSKTIYNVELPALIGVHAKGNDWIYWYEEELNVDIEIYALQIPHINHSGLVCLGNFKEHFSVKEPREYFKRIIEYPIHYDAEVLKRIEKEGYKAAFKKLGLKGKKLASLIGRTNG